MKETSDPLLVGTLNRTQATNFQREKGKKTYRGVTGKQSVQNVCVIR